MTVRYSIVKSTTMANVGDRGKHFDHGQMSRTSSMVDSEKIVRISDVTLASPPNASWTSEGRCKSVAVTKYATANSLFLDRYTVKV